MRRFLVLLFALLLIVPVIAQDGTRDTIVDIAFANEGFSTNNRNSKTGGPKWIARFFAN